MSRVQKHGNAAMALFKTHPSPPGMCTVHGTEGASNLSQKITCQGRNNLLLLINKKTEPQGADMP